MFFLDKAEVDRELKRVRRELASSGGVSDDLRGWSWDREGEVEPPAYGGGLRFGVSELAGRYCETLRDVYLRRVEGLRPPPSLKMVRGVALHDVMRRSLVEVKRVLYDRFPVPGSEVIEILLPGSGEVAVSSVAAAERQLSCGLGEDERRQLVDESLLLYKFLIVQAAARVDWVMSRFPHADVDSVVNQAIPPVAERKVDGSPVGLGRELSVDLYAGTMVLDVKTGDTRWFHNLTAAGYALAVEASEGTPIDYGAIVYVRVDLGRRAPVIKTSFFAVDDDLRREFLRYRDEAYEIVHTGRDPGKPPVCPDYCPWYPLCNPEGGGGLEASSKRARALHRG